MAAWLAGRDKAQECCPQTCYDWRGTPSGIVANMSGRLLCGAEFGAGRVADGSGPGLDERHPLAVSVNRDEHISATRPRILSLQSLSSSPSEITAHLVLERWSRRSAPVTHQDQGLRVSRRVGPWLRLQPQKTLCSPPRPILAAGLASRTALWLHRSVIQRLVAHGTGATNS